MDASAITEYFAPLLKWLEEQNKGQQCGWASPDAFATTLNVSAHRASDGTGTYRLAGSQGRS
jgi:hypothetical protein